MKNVVCLYTATYPYGHGETFLENEIITLCNLFDKVYVLPHDCSSENVRKLPHNAEVVFSYSSNPYPYQDFRAKRIISQNLISISRALIIELFKTSKKKYYISRLKSWIILLAKAIHDSQRIEEKIDLNEIRNAKHYSTWNNEWALALSFLRMKNHTNYQIVRSGGYDIYDERHKGNYMPFRGFVYKYFDAVYPNSILGEQYIKRLKIYSNKVHCRYLGTSDCGRNPYQKTDTITFVSASNVIDIKRVHLIIHLLCELDMKVKWIHFGSGERFREVRDLAQSKESDNFSFSLMGKVSNSEILEYYASNSVDYFITTSETEGLPISVQEAISFGIPIIATNVGGMSEVVKNNFGLLLNKDFEIQEASCEIKKFMRNSMKEMRKNARSHWENNFNAKTLYKEFAIELKNTTK